MLTTELPICDPGGRVNKHKASLVSFWRRRARISAKGTKQMQSKQASAGQVLSWRLQLKKKIYEAKVKTYFVLQPSIEIQNLIQVNYLN